MIAMMVAALLATEDCVAIGDSLAVGVAQSVNRHVVGTSCRVAARQGAPASRIRKGMVAVKADVAILSAGANDAASPVLESDLRTIRGSISARQVIWLIPRDPRAAAAARAICRERDDAGVDLSRYASDDGIHPRDYWKVARHAFQVTTCE